MTQHGLTVNFYSFIFSSDSSSDTLDENPFSISSNEENEGKNEQNILVWTLIFVSVLSFGGLVYLDKKFDSFCRFLLYQL